MTASISQSSSVPPTESSRKIIVGLGEVLWDLFPSGKQLGGTTANFAYHVNRLGNQGILASRVGDDLLGRELLERMQFLDLARDFIQIDPQYSSGTVHVDVDPNGQPEYTFTENVAWEFFEWTASWQQLAARADAVCFGTLAQRSDGSRDTINRFLRSLRADALRVFDVNLRQSCYSTDVLRESLRLAHIVKFNDEELSIVLHALGHDENDPICGLRILADVFDLRMSCLTWGENGSVIISDDVSATHSGFRVKVADTVGAGDAFTSAMVHHYLAGDTVATISESANRLAAWVASQVGATPEGSPGAGLGHPR